MKYRYAFLSSARSLISNTFLTLAVLLPHRSIQINPTATPERG